jgi:nitroimidazol reductase NimA-like FMN-containing flavoprotein (pyridoxamine 5'-phosphate oxidase superfamily)
MMKPVPKKLKEFCEKEELLRLSYIDHGHPRVVPVWFVVVGRQYYIGTYAGSPKWKAIKRKPDIAWVVDGGPQGKYKGVSMFGRAEEITERKLRGRIYKALGEKYFGGADHAKHIEIWGEIDDPESVYVRLKAEDGFWWAY